MKSVMLSIKPQYCELIASGKKTIEVRKTRPKLDVPFKCYIYCTKARMPVYDKGRILMYEDDLAITNRWEQGKLVENPCGMMQEDEVFLNGKVIGEFVCDEIFEIDYGIEEGVYFDGEYQEGFDTNGSGDNPTCLSFVDLENYLANNEGYGWHISDLVIYDKPKELSEFRKPCKYGGEELDMPCFSCDKAYCSVNILIDCFNIVERPPQSWCYVEELG